MERNKTKIRVKFFSYIPYFNSLSTYVGFRINLYDYFDAISK